MAALAPPIGGCTLQWMMSRLQDGAEGLRSL